MSESRTIESLETMLRECQETHGSSYGADWANWRAAQAVVDNLRTKLRGPFTDGECSVTLAKVAGWLDAAPKEENDE